MGLLKNINVNSVTGVKDVRQGQLYYDVNDNGEVYMVVRLGIDDYNLVNIDTGNRFTDGLRSKDKIVDMINEYSLRLIHDAKINVEGDIRG